MKKRLLALTLTLCMVLALLPTAAPAASTAFVIEDGVLTKYRGPGGNVVIPNGVTSIGRNAFENCAGLTSVAIPNGVTSIGELAFSGCTGLAQVTLPQGLTSIGSSAFSHCESLKNVTLPDSVTTIENAAFYWCTALESISIPGGVTRIGAEAFSVCTALRSISLPDGLTTIGSRAFCGCSNLSQVVLPDTVTVIENGAFCECPKLTGIVLPEGVTTIGEGAFRDCPALAEVTIPESVTEIGPRAFAKTPWLEKQGEFAIANGILFQYQGAGGAVTIPEGVTAIADRAFSGCGTVTEVVIPEGVESIGQEAFQNCAGLTKVTAPGTIRYVGMDAFEETPWLETCSGQVVMGNVLVYTKSGEQELTVADGVATIGPNAFHGCPELARVHIPAGVTSIDTVSKFDFFGHDKGAFGGCEKLADVYFERADAEIGRYPFSWLKRGMMMGSGTIMLREVTVHAPSGGTVEKYAIDNGHTFVSTEGEKAPVFTDVADSDYFRAPVAWAVYHGITNGTGEGKFSPGDNCQQVQILTFLWRAAGQPESSAEMPVSLDGSLRYAEGAVRWAAEMGMIDGSFDPKAPCTRSSAVKFIWQAAGSPNWGGPQFDDVPENADYAMAVEWAAGNHITDGKGDNLFAPNDVCTRGEIVTFLFRARAEITPQ